MKKLFSCILALLLLAGVIPAVSASADYFDYDFQHHVDGGLRSLRL